MTDEQEFIDETDSTGEAVYAINRGISTAIVGSEYHVMPLSMVEVTGNRVVTGDVHGHCSTNPHGNPDVQPGSTPVPVPE